MPPKSSGNSSVGMAKSTGTKTQDESKFGYLVTIVLKNIRKGEFKQGRNAHLQECIIIHGFDLIGTKSLIHRMASINNLLIISLSSMSSEN